ncbi:MAG: calcium/sodium antiporter, partial [Nanoarchaeota archaeon]|nr:calcium/sodium antiporter [Nanoarchaeota archaeon]
MAISNIILLLVGLILLIKGSDVFVSTSAKLAKKFNVSGLVIGLTVVALGTSIPELASAITAMIKGAPGLVVGNIIGSNIANIGLIIGIAALFHSLKADNKIYYRDIYILVFSSVLFYLLAFSGLLYRIEGIFFLLLYLVYIFFLFATKDEKTKKYKFRHFLDYFLGFKYVTSFRKSTIKSLKTPKEKWTKKEVKDISLIKQALWGDILIIIVSIVAITFGARYLVTGSIWLAEIFSIPQSLVGLSVIAIGTSLPELSVSITAARKGLGDIVIGNIIGSNIANTWLVLGVASLIGPIQ